jgi:Flp pilus assembly secretin CpaC
MFYQFARSMFLLLIVLLLVNCTHRQQPNGLGKYASTSDRLIHGITLLKAGRYEDSRHVFAEALRHNPSNCRANFLNAFSYDLEGKLTDDYNHIATAQVGYRIAQRFCRYEDPWPFFYSGVNNYHMNHYDEAVLDLGIAAGIAKSQADKKYILEWYATALFASGRPEMANNIIEIYLTGRTIKLGADEKALFHNIYRKMKADLASKKFVTAHADENAVAKSTGTRNPDTEKADTKKETSVKEKAATGEGTSDKSGDITPDVIQHHQVIIDAVVILTRRVRSTSAGINLLDGLQLQFGSDSHNAYQKINHKYSADFNAYNGQTSGSGSYPEVPFSKVITQVISIPAIAYDLNIFNSAVEDSEILARPTLVASEGESAEYFSGEKLILGISGGAESGGDIQKMPIGLLLKVTPEFLAGNLVKMRVTIGRDFITDLPTSDSVNFENVVNTISEKVSTTVALHYGETAILSALSEVDYDKSKESARFLDKIPLIKYLFSNTSEDHIQTYVLILLTPQPYLSFAYPKGYQEKNKLAYLYSTLVDPSSNIDNVLHGLYDMSLYRRDINELSNVLTITNEARVHSQTLDDEIAALSKTSTVKK